jgi:hypothetical protein
MPEQDTEQAAAPAPRDDPATAPMPAEIPRARWPELKAWLEALGIPTTKLVEIRLVFTTRTIRAGCAHVLAFALDDDNKIRVDRDLDGQVEPLYVQRWVPIRLLPDVERDPDDDEQLLAGARPERADRPERTSFAGRPEPDA